MGEITPQIYSFPLLTLWQLYAVVVGSMALITSFLYFVCGLWFEFRAIAILGAWDCVLCILWAAVSIIFAKMYLNEKPEMDDKIKQMKVAAGFDIANTLLWLISGAVSISVFWISRGTLLHTGRTTTPKAS